MTAKQTITARVDKLYTYHSYSIGDVPMVLFSNLITEDESIKLDSISCKVGKNLEGLKAGDLVKFKAKLIQKNGEFKLSHPSKLIEKK